MKTFTAGIAAALISGFILGSTLAPPTAPRSDFQAESTIWIDGTSSVHDWTCEVSGFDGYIESDLDAKGELQIRRAETRVPVEQIECKNGKMNSKTQKALKADTFPMISFIMDSIEGVESEESEAVVSGRLKIAGVERVVAIPTRVGTVDSGRISIKGEVPLLMSDFDITPPTAMLGMLKTGNEITVRFDVVVTAPAEERLVN